MHVFMLFLGLMLVSIGCSSGNAPRDAQPDVRKGSMIYVIPASMGRIGTIDERFQSYNVEMLEVTGGKFWKPYGQELNALLQKGHQAAPTSSQGGDTPAGMNPALYQYRPPIDLTNTRLRKLAKALAPAYVRVSGTWANTTYFPNSDQAPKSPPAGFNGVLTRQQWKALVDFANLVDAGIVTSFAISAGTRDAAGAWTPAQASRVLEYTKSVGGQIAAAEFMNEPNLASMGGAPIGYDATAYGRDFKSFRAFAKKSAPEMLILGPGSVGETTGEWGVAYGTAPGTEHARPAHIIRSRHRCVLLPSLRRDLTTVCCYGQADYGGRHLVGRVARAHRSDPCVLP